jgi:hypothetical protein
LHDFVVIGFVTGFLCVVVRFGENADAGHDEGCEYMERVGCVTAWLGFFVVFCVTNLGCGF